ncbi:hypothetical protein PIB30_022555 [Stylosanthes scabra]|uniref:PiggyBac transposable element-derived protein domain-containing protein n=1 Tax=Stylosanthes scabra TaxID=79078 RepID=A0ABU6X808_9FABA|nr:hypothetical protein [Stylosanthes scabra]
MPIPKVEQCVVSSPASMLITDVLMSMTEDTTIEPQPEEESQPDPSMPSFSLNLDNPTPQADEQPSPKTLEEEFPLTARTMAVIKSLDEQVRANAPALETPQQTQVEDDDFEERVATWATVPKGVVGLMCHILNGEECERYEKMVYCIPPEILTRMLEAHHHNWIDKKKRRPHEITSLTNHKEYLSYIDLFVMKWMKLIDPTKLHGCCTYNIEQWTDPMLNEFRKKIVAKIIMSKENTMRADAIRAAHEM